MHCFRINADSRVADRRLLMEMGLFPQSISARRMFCDQVSSAAKTLFHTPDVTIECVCNRLQEHHL